MTGKNHGSTPCDLPVQRALISVADKTDLLPFVKELIASGVQILSTGGTAQFLLENNLSVTQVSDFTGFPEILGGRVKTLHPKIFSGLLHRPGIDKFYLTNEPIQSIDLLIVNLYPFAATIAKPNCQFAEAIENIDIGGSALLRAAAKNHQVVTAVCDPQDYPQILNEIKQNAGHIRNDLRRRLATKVFAYTAQYDQNIMNYLDSIDKKNKEEFPNQLHLTLTKTQNLRYGENPHQQAAVYHFNASREGDIAILQGKPLSYCNLLDSDAALNIVQCLDANLAGCAIVKHATPCGVAQNTELSVAYAKALASDPVSAFGGIIALNRPLDKETALLLLKQPLIEVILAPEIPEKILKLFENKPNWRLLTYHKQDKKIKTHLQSVSHGVLIQQTDQIDVDIKNWPVVTHKQPNAQEWMDLQFAWRIAAFTKSNAIVLAKNQQTLGIGAGQTSRVFSAEIAILKAAQCQHSIHSAVAASDGFFPFPDGVLKLAAAGISAIIQPGGSKKDPEVIAAADSANISMVLTGTRHFRH